jgi:signal transduction histidine kinase/CheY-like chemotaxis protein/HPt (histidine-containing phosphotransfer) domain-containing protein/HAMP domain-containing protein
MFFLFIISALGMNMVNHFNLRRVYEKNYTDRVIFINNLIANMINSDDVKYYVDLMQKQDRVFRSRQTQFYHDREELNSLVNKNAPPEQQTNLLERVQAFHRGMNMFKQSNYWHTVKELRELKEISRSKYMYIFADTGVVTYEGEKLCTYIFDAEDSDDIDHYNPDSDGLGTVFLGDDVIETIYETKKPMDTVMYSDDYYGKLYYAYAPILDDDGNIIAIMGTDLGLEEMYQEISKSAFLFRMVYLSFVIFTMLIIFFFLRIFIAKPLIVLTNTAQKIAEGSVYTSVPDTVLRYHNELGILASAIDDMSGIYQSMIKNTEKMFAAAAVGKLDVRDEVSKYKGDIQKVIKQVNDTLDAMTLYLNNIPESIFIMNHDFKMYFRNERYVKYFGDMSAREFIANMFPRDLEYEEALYEKQLADILADILKQPDNKTKVWINNLCFSITFREIDLNNPAENSVLVIAVDITALMKEKENVQLISKAKSDFLSRMSHEVRTPMNAILGITAIQLQNENISPDTQEALDEISNAGYLLMDIINDILDLSKIEAGKLELVPVNYDVASLINDTVHLNIMRHDSKLIEFKLKVDENIPSTLYGDELRIKQILNNLLSNAFKYTDAGQVSLSVTGEYTGQDEQITLVFRVSDTGQGMTKEQVGKLFDEYSRFNMEANRKIEGTGLGMSIMKYLVQLMNGEISVESEMGKGSAFTVRLPQGIVVGSGLLGKGATENLQQFRLGRASQMKRTPQIIREYMPYGRILIVDDVNTNLYVIRGLLVPYGLSVETVTSGFETIDKIRSGASYDIIFMDHFMPKMDGIEAVKIIREWGYTYPIVALTANALAGQAEIFMANGFNDFISKPIDIRQLNTVLNKFVRDRYPPETVDAARRLKDGLKDHVDDVIADSAPTPSADPELAENFIRDAERSFPILETIHKNNYRRNDDIQTFVVNVHAMKSALANIGETELSRSASKLEEAGRVRDVATMTSEIPMFLNSLRDVIEKIRPRDTTDEVSLEDSDPAYLHEKLLVIQTACVSYDERAANAALDELRQKAWPLPVKELLSSIAEHLLHSEFEEAAALVEKYEKK